MKIITSIFIFLTITVYSQNDITNTLGTNGQYIVKDAVNELFIIDQSSGNVGVGKSPESYKVDVNGDINVSGSFKVNGTAIPASSLFSVSWLIPSTYTIFNNYYLGCGTTSSVFKDNMFVVPKSGNTISIYVVSGNLTSNHSFKLYKAEDPIGTGNFTPIDTGISVDFNFAYLASTTSNSYNYSAGDVFAIKHSSLGSSVNNITFTVVFE